MALFYNRPRAVQAEAHGALRINPCRNYAFAAATNAIPLAADEFAVAQGLYPIVFTADQPSVAVAVLGIRDQENLFVGADGQWRSGSYIPAYVRRYPFALAKIEGRDDSILILDETAEVLSDEQGERLFAEGRATPAIDRAMKFCTAFQRQFDIAQQFAAALQEADLLVENRMELRRPDGSVPYAFTGFRIIDQARLGRLDDPIFLDWRKRNWLALVYAHLFSLRRWESLAALQTRHGPAAASEPKGH